MMYIQRTRITVILIALALVAALTACGLPQIAQRLATATPTPAPLLTLEDTELPPSMDTALQHTQWMLTSLRGGGLVEGSRITLNFTGEGYEGFMGCNSYRGSLEAAARGILTLGEIAVTVQACPGPAGIQEKAYIEAFTSAAAYRLSEDLLELQDASGETVLVYAPPSEYAVKPATREPLYLQDTTRPTGTLGVLTIGAYIDGRSQLVVQGDAVHWHHLAWAAPGRHLDLGTNEPTYLNGVAWYPTWPDSPDAENRDCGCDSSTYVGIPPLAPRDQMVSLELVQAREKVTVVQQPEEDNDYTLIVEFDDEVSLGLDWYEVDISYVTGGQPAGLPAAPGQTVTPTAVPSPAAACAFGGPYQPDEHTLLLLHFDGSYTGAQGETGSAKGTEFTPGRYGQGVRVDGTDTLTYSTAGNINSTQGAVEFWVQPQWNGDDGEMHVFFETADPANRGIQIAKDGVGNLHFILWTPASHNDAGCSLSDWRTGEWHHLAAIWSSAEMSIHVDGRLCSQRDGVSPPAGLGGIFYVGGSPGLPWQADAVLDELRISDVPRLGNSDTCGTVASRPSASPSVSSLPTWQLQSPLTSPSPRMEMGFVYDTARNVVVAVGGTDWTVAFSETWEYDGVNWTLRDDLPQSPGRIRPAVAYDQERQVTVLFGGSNLGDTRFFNDTWEYDGYQWLQKQLLNRPSPRNSAAMAYDPIHKRMLLFGGYNRWEPASFLDDTWEYEDGQWFQRSPAHHPEAREAAALVYDSRRGVMVLFGGGRMAGSVVFNDTWEWDGNDWTQRLDLPSSPPARWAQAMAYDEDRGCAVLFGGLTGVTGQYGDTWEYDGQSWSQITTSMPPPGRWDPGMAYDALHHRIVLFGGQDWDGAFGWLNDTWHYVPAAAGGFLPDSALIANFDATLEPGVSHGWLVRPSAADAGYIVEVTPLRPSVDGAHLEKALVRPEYNGDLWNDVLRVRIPADMPPLEVNVRVYQSSGLPVVSDFEAVLTSGDWQGWILGPASLDRGFVVEVTPLEPAVDGARVEKALVQAEYSGGEWHDVLRAQIPEGQPDLRVRFRVYATAGMAVITAQEVTLEPGAWIGVALRPSMARGGYVVEINPLEKPIGGEFVERVVVQPEFNGEDWSDVLRLQAPADQPPIRVQVRVYGWEEILPGLTPMLTVRSFQDVFGA